MSCASLFFGFFGVFCASSPLDPFPSCCQQFPQVSNFSHGCRVMNIQHHDFSNYCTWEVLLFTLCLLTNTSWLCFNLKLQSGNRTETPSPATPESVTGTLSTYIHPKLTQISRGCFNITKAVLMKEDSDVLVRMQIISHGSCLPLQEPGHTLNSDGLFHLCIDFLLKSQPFDLLNI